MAASTIEITSLLKELSAPPPPGSPHSVALPNSAKEGRSPVYRHWRFKDVLLRTLDPAITNVHDMFESTAIRQPSQSCFGYRPFDRATKTYGPYQWMDYQTVQRRRADFGAGLVELHRRIGVTTEKYGVGLWCQNRTEWQLTGTLVRVRSSARCTLNLCRPRMHVSGPLVSLDI